MNEGEFATHVSRVGGGGVLPLTGFNALWSPAAKPHYIFDPGKSALNLMKGGKLCIFIFIFVQTLFIVFFK